MIKLVALDLDGTIVDDQLNISERTLELLGHLISDTEVRVVIATGRMFPSALPFAQKIGVVEPLISYQGAMIRDIDNGHALRYHNPIPRSLAQKLLEYLAEETYAVNMYLNDELWTCHSNEHAFRYARTAGVEPIFTNCLVSSLGGDPTKIMVIDDHRVDHLLGELNRLFVGQLSYCRSRSNFCEMINVSCSKWNAINTLIENWDIRPEEVMAIGDQGNDISMIRAAGVGVAMGNAPDDVKAEANYVTGAIDDDGAAEAIEKFVLGDMPFREEPVANEV